MDRRRLILDASLALSLLLALLLVSGSIACGRPPRRRGSPCSRPPFRPAWKNRPLASPLRAALRIGVTPARPEYDDMGSLLKSLGEGYKYRGFPLEDLGDLAKISEYNIIFLTCSGVAETWVKDRLGQAARDNMIKVTVDEATMKRVSDNLRTFVGNGGTLYVSDLHFDLVASAFPELVDFRKVGTAANRPSRLKWSIRGCEN